MLILMVELLDAHHDAVVWLPSSSIIQLQLFFPFNVVVCRASNFVWELNFVPEKKQDGSFAKDLVIHGESNV